jgi:4a-hydroxytetrahydrobiopterin dehydratase
LRILRLPPALPVRGFSSLFLCVFATWRPCVEFGCGFGSAAFSRDHPPSLWHPYGMAKLSPSQIKAALPSIPKWRKRGSNILRTFEFADFAAAMKFVNAVARRAEKADHHPDIDIRWNKVTLALSTHSAGGLTRMDFDLAASIDALA